MTEVNRAAYYVAQRRWDGARNPGEWIDTSPNYWVHEDDEAHVRSAVFTLVDELRETFGEDAVRAVRRVITTTEEEVEL